MEVALQPERRNCSGKLERYSTWRGVMSRWREKFDRGLNMPVHEAKHCDIPWNHPPCHVIRHMHVPRVRLLIIMPLSHLHGSMCPRRLSVLTIWPLFVRVLEWVPSISKMTSHWICWDQLSQQIQLFSSPSGSRRLAQTFNDMLGPVIQFWHTEPDQ